MEAKEENDAGKGNAMDNNGILSKRPWSNSAKEIEFVLPNGTTRKEWTMTVLDANGNVVCFGKSADMKFITEMENAFNGIADMLESHKSTTETALELLKSFRRTAKGDKV